MRSCGRQLLDRVQVTFPHGRVLRVLGRDDRLGAAAGPFGRVTRTLVRGLHRRGPGADRADELVAPSRLWLRRRSRDQDERTPGEDLLTSERGRPDRPDAGRVGGGRRLTPRPRCSASRCRRPPASSRRSSCGTSTDDLTQGCSKETSSPTPAPRAGRGGRWRISEPEHRWRCRRRREPSKPALGRKELADLADLPRQKLLTPTRTTRTGPMVRTRRGRKQTTVTTAANPAARSRSIDGVVHPHQNFPPPSKNATRPSEPKARPRPAWPGRGASSSPRWASGSGRL